MANPTVNEWADMMPHTITVEPWVSYKGGGAGSNYGDAETYSCRIEMGNHLVVDANSKTASSKGKVFLLSTTVIGTKDLVTLPTGYVPTNPPLITVDVNDDEDGTHHCCLHF